MRHVLLALWFAGSLQICYAAENSYCEPSAATKSQLKGLENPNLKGKEARDAQKKEIDELVTANPGNLFLEERYQRIHRPETEAEWSALINRFRKLAQDHPNDPVYAYLYASALIGKDTPQALTIAQRLAGGSPSFAPAYLVLAEIHRWGRYEDKAKVRTEVASFFAACPAALNDTALQQAESHGGAEYAAKLAPQLRKRLEGETDFNLLENWTTVWNLEFKGRPVTEHSQIRKQISTDMTRLAAANSHPDASWLAFLRDGYHLAGDEAASKAQGAALMTRFPESRQARQQEEENWEKAHPWPGSDETRKKAYWTATLARADERLKRHPDDDQALVDRFDAHAGLKDLSPSRLTDEAESMLRQINKNHDYLSMPPLALRVARAYAEAKVRPDELRQLVEQGRQSAMAMYGLPRDNDSAAWKESIRESADDLGRQAASILLDAATQLNKPEMARDAVAKVEAQSIDKPAEKSSQQEIRAKWAELQGRKLDALLLYRAALNERPSSEKPPKDDDLAQRVDRLWKELGGTDVSRALLNAKPAVATAESDGRWEKPGKEMKDWQLTDLHGKTWKLASLEGKTVLVNIWATWCGPCKAEHPHLEKLYEQLKNDPKFEIVTFNIDDEVGNVEPYVKENNYTFPVLLAKDYADELSVDSIPRNWIVDTKGKWQWEQIGFGSEDKWEDEMLQKLKDNK